MKQINMSWSTRSKINNQNLNLSFQKESQSAEITTNVNVPKLNLQLRNSYNGNKTFTERIVKYDSQEKFNSPKTKRDEPQKENFFNKLKNLKSHPSNQKKDMLAKRNSEKSYDDLRKQLFQSSKQQLQQSDDVKFKYKKSKFLEASRSKNIEQITIDNKPKTNYFPKYEHLINNPNTNTSTQGLQFKDSKVLSDLKLKNLRKVNMDYTQGTIQKSNNKKIDLESEKLKLNLEKDISTQKVNVNYFKKTSYSKQFKYEIQKKQSFKKSINEQFKAILYANIQYPSKLLKFAKKDFNIGGCKGDGKFGKVYPCIHKSTGVLFAIKQISKEAIKSNQLQAQLTWQIKLQSFFNHPNIVKLYGFFTDSINIYLLLQYMESGTLFEYLKKKNSNGLPQQEVSKRMTQICSAVYYLHDLDVAHRDIKPENIVLSNGVAKLCDFGWSTRTMIRRTTYCGTFDYAPPQILQGKEYDACVDLWSLGILTFELLTGKLPFYNISRKQTMKNILNADIKGLIYPANTSWQVKDFIQKLLKKEPEERVKAEVLLKHPFLEKYREDTFR